MSILPLLLFTLSLPATETDVARSAERTPITEVPGWVRPLRSITLHPPGAGTVFSILAQEGGQVRQGELLLSLEDPVTVAAVETARLQAEQKGPLEFAASELKYAERLLERVGSIRDERGVSAHEREQAAAARDKAQANLTIAIETAALAKSRYELERSRLQSLRFTAPFDGIVASIDVEVGARVFEDAPMLRLIDPSELTVVLHHPWRYRDRLQVGMTQQLQAEAPLDRPITAVLVHIDPVLDVALQAVRCRWRIDNSNGELPAGFLVTADCEPWPVIDAALPSSNHLSSTSTTSIELEAF